MDLAEIYFLILSISIIMKYAQFYETITTLNFPSRFSKYTVEL